jgi:hypothetical protein
LEDEFILPEDREVRVAVVGAGIAGLTSALRLSQRGYQVTLYEAQDIIGGNLSSRDVDGMECDVYPHMFGDWYANFWEIFEKDLGLDRAAYFEPRAGVKVLRNTNSDYLDLKNPTTFRSVWENLRSGVLPLPDMFLVGFSMLDLASAPFHRSELLERLSVNGFLHSRAYATERCAQLLDFVLMEIWSIHGDLTSAASFKDFAKHVSTFPHPRPFAWVLKGSLRKKLMAPMQRKLEHLKCEIKTCSEVKRVEVKNGKPEIVLTNNERPPMDYLVLAVPPQALAKLVMDGPPGSRIVDRLPQLSELRRLRAERIPVVDLYFRRKLPNIPKEHVGLSSSRAYLTFLDISQLWADDDKMRERTVLVLAASDFYALPSQVPEEEGYTMIKRLHEYLPVFDPGRSWGDPKSDICWKDTRFLSNETNKLYINEVGAEVPEASYDALPDVFFAGDFCAADAMATIEAAVQSGLKAAQALWRRKPLGPAITMAESRMYGDAALLAMKLALTPFAYSAKCWSTALDAVPDLEKGTPPRGIISSAASMVSLPLTYTADWWETAYALCESVLRERTRLGKPP